MNKNIYYIKILKIQRELKQVNMHLTSLNWEKPKIVLMISELQSILNILEKEIDKTEP
tara:strand:- start:167 stop:340 length:174 start_codon:yes stop_codon:yes gene_type:complete